MKHQQGEQEALAHELFTAAQLAPGEGIEDAVGRLAALVEAQQSEVASSSIFDGVIPAAIRSYLRKCSSGGMSKKHIDIVQINVDEAERLDYFKLAIAEAVIASRVAAPQPAPVAPAVQQAVSQPAKVWDYPPMPDFDTVEQHIYGACRRYITQDMLEPIHNLIRDAIDADRAARAPADSTPAWASQAVIEYRYTGGTHWCQLGPAERMKPNFDGVYRLQGGVFPVDAPADSMTAPASGEVAYLDIGAGGYLDLGTDLSNEALSRLPYGRHALVIAGTYGIDGYTPTPPTQAANIALEDAERYRFLAARCRITGEHWGGRWSIVVEGSAPESHDSKDDFDAAIDAARKQGGAA